ncbi:MAG: MFS transporter [candidate division FCPU426 bacterium]
MTGTKTTGWFSLAVVVGALGYFVDIYDLILFSVVRVPSLRSLGVPEDQILSTGIHLLNWQMTGMLLGGILWGVLGDKRGRISVLFGSILLYSLANLANAWVQTPQAYAWLRFIAGLGLAGELGAAITLVSEILPKEKRGLGTTIVATVGVSGAVVANLVARHFDWRNAYIVGGVLGLALLLMRFGILESGIFKKSTGAARRGDFSMLFTDWGRFKRYLSCVLIGLPTWFVIGVLITLSPEIAKSRGIDGVTGGNAIMYAYIGLVLGDLSSGLISQAWKSRKKVVLMFLVLTFAATVANLTVQTDVQGFYWLCLFSGFAVGYWAMFVTIAAEQFGTNLRSTVATTTPNWARGALVPIALAFQALLGRGVSHVNAAFLVGTFCVGVALLAAWGLKDTFGHDLDYLEGEIS